mmetsp:Transcript_63141/g.112217  ORF Transcript_63141/g.112217 Transcript_63141/m.112217 type:complete len:93 (+) Transcript_63141:977-1255(+)
MINFTGATPQAWRQHVWKACCQQFRLVFRSARFFLSLELSLGAAKQANYLIMDKSVPGQQIHSSHAQISEMLCALMELLYIQNARQNVGCHL